MTETGALHGHSLLAVMAHPDDESLACGGTLALCARRGARTAVLCLTRGEHGADTDPAATKARATVRTAELHAAAAALGISDLVVLDYEDGFLPWVDAAALERDIRHVIDRLAPDVVVTFDEDGLYWHPDHVAVHERTTAAVSAIEVRPPVLYYVTMPPGRMRALVDGVAGRTTEAQSHTAVLGIENPDAFGAAAPPPTHIVDVRAFARYKLQALRRHATQVGDGAVALVTPDDAPLWLGLEQYRRAPVGSADPSFLDLLPETAILDVLNGQNTCK
jgi:N-acetyl-1-D-myo-inositol-2-amino-2-deoxy-alpha-D-glucopyranoside deacetylase